MTKAHQFAAYVLPVVNGETRIKTANACSVLKADLQARSSHRNSRRGKLRLGETTTKVWRWRLK